MRRIRALTFIAGIVLGYTFQINCQEIIQEWTFEFTDDELDRWLPTVENDIDNPGFFGLRNGSFEINDMEGQECGSSNTGNNGNRGILFSGIVRGGYCDVSISFETHISDAPFEQCLSPGTNSPIGCTDFIGLTPGGDGMTFEVVYNGSFVMTGGYCGPNREGTFNISGLEINIGDSYQVFITGGTQSPEESYFIDRILVKGFPKSVVPPEIVANSDSYCDQEGALFLNEISGGVSYTWYKDGVMLSETSDTYIKTPVTVADAGLYEVDFVDSNGCHYQAELMVHVEDCSVDSIIFNLDSVFCSGDLLILPSISDNGITGTWNSNSPDNILSEAGANSLLFSSTDGTASYVYDYVVFKSYSDTIYPEICPGDVFSIQGIDLSYEGMNSTTIADQSRQGCDSITFVEIMPLDASRYILRDTLCEGGELLINGQILNIDNPEYLDTLVNGLGCDSIIDVVLHFNTSQVSIYDPIICANDFVIVNNNKYDMSRPSGTEIFVDGQGCDSIVDVDISFIIPDTTWITSPICNDEVVLVNGIGYGKDMLSGIESIVGTDGCDSVVVIELSLGQSDTILIDAIICTSDNLQVGDGIYDINNPKGIERMLDQNGCDSLVQVDLRFFESDTVIISDMRCANDGYEIIVNGEIYNEARPNGKEILNDRNGCDSIVIIDLMYLSAITGLESYNGCQGDGYEVSVNGMVYNESRPTGEERLFASSGCDSLVSVVLNFGQQSFGSINYEGCADDGYEIEVNGTLYNEMNPTGLEQIESSNGCDSIVEISLVYAPPIYYDLIYEGCASDGFSTEVNGEMYDIDNPSGVEILRARSGCDSIVMIDLFYYFADTTELLRTECTASGYTINVNGVAYNQDNPIGTELLTNVLGCDSIVKVNLTFKDEIITSLVDTLCSDESRVVDDQLFDINNKVGQVTMKGAGGCDSIIEVNLKFYPREELDIFVDTIDPIGLYQLSVFGVVDTSQINWAFDPSLSCTSCPDPIVTVSSSQTYEVRILDENGCEIEESISFVKTSEAPSFYLPNIINLNSTTGNNMIRPVVPKGIKAVYDLTIYDRWGGIVYDAQQISTVHNNLGWRGMVDGKRANSGTYIYLVKLYFNGSRDPITRRGTVTIY